ncbi:TetR/AcrR family transcriptional regulator [Nocardia brasiliensis]|uniref:TetR/AcrR family transcriptional regulator n=1 Tax=Nocardia brasiliensis TaxID=37326 RepID=UPI00366F55C0
MTENRGPKRRADAERSRTLILEAAVRLLAERPGAGMATIADEAGVTRQTVYAHFASRDELLTATVDHITGQAKAAFDAAQLDDGPATDALLRLLDIGWRFFRKSPILHHVGAFAGPSDRSRGVPLNTRLLTLIRRGQQAGEFEPAASPQWLVTAIIALGNAAGDEVRNDRMTVTEAQKALRHSVLRLVSSRPAPDTKRR